MYSIKDEESTSSRFKNLLMQNMLTFWNYRLVEIRNAPGSVKLSNQFDILLYFVDDPPCFT